MSADRWTICPKCKAKNDADYKAKRAKAEAAYGKVPQAAYLAGLKDTEKKPELEETLRHDWSIGLNEPAEHHPLLFEVDYYCSCQVCDFKFHYKKTVDLNDGPHSENDE